MGLPPFAYDALSRLCEGRAVATGSTHEQTTQFDPFGTRSLLTTTWNNHLTYGTLRGENLLEFDYLLIQTPACRI